MDIFEFAMEKERHAEEYYRQLAEKVDHTGLKNILTMLADEEAKHYETVQKIKANTTLHVKETPVLKDAKAIFAKMKKDAERFSFDISEVDLYRKACDIEAESKKYYLQKAGEVADPAQEKVLRRLADEENKHLVLVQSLSDFVARPETYLEDAEFDHLDGYVDGDF
jgi:rubrerythrin